MQGTLITLDYQPDNPLSGELTPTQRTLRDSMMQQIREAQDSIGHALHEVKRSRLYRETHPNFVKWLNHYFPKIDPTTGQRKINNYKFNCKARKKKLPEACQAITDVLHKREFGIRDKIAAWEECLSYGCETADDVADHLRDTRNLTTVKTYPKKPNIPKKKIHLTVQHCDVHLFQNDNWGKWRIKKLKHGDYICRRSVPKTDGTDWVLAIGEKMREEGIIEYDIQVKR
jgi:hypothetical protein